MIKIRKKVFETNSSSTHSLTFCTKDEFNKWKTNELLFNYWDSEELVSVDSPKVKTDLLEFINKELPSYISELSEIEGKSKEELIKYTLENYALDFAHSTGLYTYEAFFEDYDCPLESYSQEYTTPKGETVIAFGRFGFDG